MDITSTLYNQATTHLSTDYLFYTLLGSAVITISLVLYVCNRFVNYTDKHHELAEREIELLYKNTMEKLQAAKADLADLEQLDIENKVKYIKEQYTNLELSFRNSMNSDVTLAVLYAAYAVVTQNNSTRDEADILLIKSVISHKNADSPQMPGSPVVVPPESWN